MVAALASVAAAPSAPAPFASEIDAFVQADRARPSPPCAVLFVGSSSIRLWRTLEQDMAPLPVVNRGFGGSSIVDVNRYFEPLVTPHRPRAIVLYAGENDIDAGRTPAQTTEAFRRFLALKTQRLGDVPVYFIALKPSKLRWAQRPRQAAVNAAVEALAARRDDLHFIDVAPSMLEDGRPREIFEADGLHMTADGYAIWTRLVRPVLEADATRPSRCAASG